MIEIYCYYHYTGNVLTQQVLRYIGGHKMAKSKLMQVNKKIEEKVVSNYQKLEDIVIDKYTKMQDSVVSGYKNIEDRFVDQYLTHDEESIEETKKRLAQEKLDRKQKHTTK